MSSQHEEQKIGRDSTELKKYTQALLCNSLKLPYRTSGCETPTGGKAGNLLLPATPEGFFSTYSSVSKEQATLPWKRCMDREQQWIKAKLSKPSHR